MQQETRVSRRRFIKQAGTSGLLLTTSGGLLSACGVNKDTGTSTGGGGAGSGATKLRIGYVSPQTGPAAGFGETDAYLIAEVKKATKDGITVGGKKYDLEFIVKDSAADPQRAATVANDLITGSKIDLMLASSTPESVNPVSDACEANGVPCISTVVPWQAWYYGRGAKPTDKEAYKFTYHFCFGVENFASAYAANWEQVPTNKKVGVLWPNDSDGKAIRASLGPLLEKAGFQIVDPGAYEDGINDFSAQISKFKAADCQIFNSFALPPDFATFWKQAAQQGYAPKIPQIAKTGLFPSQVEALGKLGSGVVSAALWHKTYPYKSSLTGLSSQELASGYEAASGKQWTQILGTGFALFDAGIAALQAAKDPQDKVGLAAAIGTLKVDTPVGTLDWNKGPVKNVVTTPIPGCQWVPATGGKFKYDTVIVEHSDDPKILIGGKLKAWPTFQ